MRGRIERLEEVRGADQDAAEALTLQEQLVRLRDAPLGARIRPVGQEAVGLIEQQKGAFIAGLAKHRSQLLLGDSEIGRKELGGGVLDERTVGFLRQVLGQCDLAGTKGGPWTSLVLVCEP